MIDELLSFVDLADDDKDLVRTVVENAKQYFASLSNRLKEKNEKP